MVYCKQNLRARITSMQLENIELKHIILDSSCINYVDAQGIQAIMWLYEQYKLINVSVYLSYPKRKINPFIFHILK